MRKLNDETSGRIKSLLSGYVQRNETIDATIMHAWSPCLHAHADRDTDTTEQGSLLDLEEKVSRSSVLEVPHSDTHFVCRCATWRRIEIECEVWTPYLPFADLGS